MSPAAGNDTNEPRESAVTLITELPSSPGPEYALAPPEQKHSGPFERWVRNLCKKLIAPLGKAHKYSLRVTYADGSTFENFSVAGDPDIQIVFNNKRGERRTVVYFPDGLIEGWIDGDIDFIGDLPVTKLAELAHQAFADTPSRNMPVNPFVRIRQIARELKQNNRNFAKAKSNADYHYAIDARFFEMMLGSTVGYSEGYWTEGTINLDQAKFNNYEYVCRKLRLQPGDKVLEVGSGWGYMPIYMAKNYGCEVTVYNPVKAQNDYMMERFKRQGVADRIRLYERDHRDIVQEGPVYDKFVTIGVQEHAGRWCYRQWANSIAAALKPGGIGLVSTTNLMHWEYTNGIILDRIFPGGHIPSLPLTLQSFDEAGLMLTEIESLWPHYQRTLMEWATNVERNWSEIQKLNPAFFTESFRRKWAFYLQGTIENFHYALDLSHIVFRKGRDVAGVYDLKDESSRRDIPFATGHSMVDPLR
jgi:cyclopropane-fatty-acyl-phospholipid synthase